MHKYQEARLTLHSHSKVQQDLIHERARNISLIEKIGGRVAELELAIKRYEKGVGGVAEDNRLEHLLEEVRRVKEEINGLIKRQK